MKILIATGIYPPQIGGPATYSKLLFERLPEFGIDVEILNFGSYLQFPKGVRHILFFFKLLALSRGAKILYAQDPVSVGLPAALASFVLRKPFFIRVAGDYAWEQAQGRFGITDSIDDFQNKRYGFRIELLRSVQKFVVRRAVQVITPSNYFRILVGGWLPNPDKVITIYNGIDAADAPDALVQREKTIISAGRLVVWKGFEALIDVLSDLPEWKLFIAGDGPEQERLEKIIQQKGLSERVFLLGQVARNDLMKLVAESELFVLNTHFESFSFQVVEAMRLRTPVITTTIGNLGEIIEDGTEGILVEPDNKEELRKAIEKMHSDGGFRAACAENAYTKSLKFDIRETLRQLKEVMLPFL